MVNALLVYPKIPANTYWSFNYSLPFINKKTGLPPLGLITVAAMLPKEYTLKLIDENVELLKDEHIQWADIVFISSMVIQADSIENVIKRANYFNVPIVAGGPFPTQYYDDVRLKGVDHFVLGEAENGVLDVFLKDFENGCAKKVYAKQTIRKNKEISQKIDMDEWNRLKIFFNDEIEQIEQRPDLKKTAIPRYDLLKIKSYGSMAVQFSRGCPFNCDFCNETTLFGNTPRLKIGKQIVSELDEMYKLGYEGGVFFVDDNFIGNIKKAKEALYEIIEFQKKNKYPFSFYTEASINLAQDEELMKLMQTAGFNMVFIGLETTSKEALQKIGKSQNIKADFVKDVKKINSYSMEVTAGLIVGLDDEPADINDKIFEFCQEAGIPTAMAGLLVVVRGSELYEKFKRDNRLLAVAHEGNNTHSFELNYIPDRNRNPNAIIKSYKELLSRLYDKNGKNYFQRCQNLIHNIVPGKSFTRPIKMHEVSAFVKSMTKQGLFERYSLNYMRLLIHTFFHKIEVLPEAVRLGIMGHHLIKITQDAVKADEVKVSLEKRITQFKQSFNDMVERNIPRQRIKNLIKEKDRFLCEARKRIKKLPDEYRQELIAMCKNFENFKYNMNANQTN